MNTCLLFSISLLLLVACKPTTQNRLSITNEIMAVENAFMQMAREHGVDSAFLYYADSNAVINRGRRLIRGIDSIRMFYQEQDLEGIRLEWEPSFVDVAASGDLAYTYGYFTYSTIDSAGAPITTDGVFHTVWKRQSDGSWKYVWD